MGDAKIEQTLSIVKRWLYGIIVLMILLSYAPSLAQTPDWEQWMPEPGAPDPISIGHSLRGQHISETDDGGLIILASLDYWGRSDVIRTDFRGRKKWELVLGDSAHSYQALTVRSLSDGGFEVAGRYAPGDPNEAAFCGFYQSISSNGICGSTTVSLVDSGTNIYRGAPVAFTSDTALIDFEYLPGISFTKAPDGIRLQRIERNGHLGWRRDYRKALSDSSSYFVQAIARSRDGSYFGYLRASNPGHWDKTYLLKCTSNGVVIWQRQVGGIAADSRYSNDVAATRDGGAVCLSFHALTDSEDNLYARTILTKVDSAGNPQWEREYKSPRAVTIGESICQATDGGYVVAGYTGQNYHIANTNDFYLLRTDSLGTTIWSKEWGTDSADVLLFVKQASDGSFLVSGYGDSVGDLYLAKIRDDVAAVTENLSTPLAGDMRISLTPGSVRIDYSQSKIEPAKALLSDQLGRRILQTSSVDDAPGRHGLTCSVAGLAPGFYFVTLHVDSKNITRPLIIMH